MKYPLFYRYFEEIRTESWRALVQVQGRCLMELEDDAWWIEGVQPGGIVGSASTQQAAQSDFRNRWRHLIEDLAHEAPTAENFKQRMESLVHQVTKPAEKDWQEARATIRGGAALDEYFERMQRVYDDMAPLIQVQAVDYRPAQPVVGSNEQEAWMAAA